MSAPEVLPPVDGLNQAPVDKPAPPPMSGAPYKPPLPAPNANASLYVGELDPTVTEAILFEIFNMIGPVASIRVCRDAVTRRSLGYAYVNYLNAADGERALEQLNYSLIKGHPCRIMWSQRDPALRKTGQGNIFIKNLDEAIDNKALHDTFVAFGNVLSCKVAVDEQSNSKGYGFVHYETSEAAENAIKAVNGMLLNDKKVFVGHHIPKKERQSKLEEIRSQYTNLYVKNIDTDLNLEEFKMMFESYGTITSAVIQSDDDGKNKGFGFVNFETHDQAAKAVEALHDKEINGKKLFVARAQKKQEREEELRRSFEAAKMEKLSKWQGVNLYVKNIDDDMDDDRLRAEFEPFGTITSAKIMRDEKGGSKGFGFVCYSSPDEATKAVAEMNNKMIGNKPLYVSLAQRRDVRRQQLENQIAQRNQIRMQQAAAAGISNGYLNTPMYFPPGAGYPPQGPGRGHYGFQPNMGGRGGYRGAQVPVIPPMPGYAGPQGYGMPGYPGGAPPRGPPGPPRGNAPNAANGASPAARAPSATAPAAGGTPSAAGRTPLPPAAGTAAAPKQAIQIPGLLNNPPEQQKQMIGEHIYIRVFEQYPDLAGKITGMLLEMDITELLSLLDDVAALDLKISEALAVLENYKET